MADLALLHEHYAVWIWAGLAAALLAVEMMTGSGWLLWPAASAGAVAILVKVLGFDLRTAALVFAALTIVTTFLARRYLPNMLVRSPGPDINDASARLLGHHGRAVTPFKRRL